MTLKGARFIVRAFKYDLIRWNEDNRYRNLCAYYEALRMLERQ